MGTRSRHEFTVPVPAQRAWEVLSDVERLAACVPGATVESVDGATATVKARVRVGRTTVTYRGDVRLSGAGAPTRPVSIEAHGTEARGPGTVTVDLTGHLTEQGAATLVTVESDVSVTGRMAEFDDDVRDNAGVRLLDGLAANLATELGDSEARPAGGGAPRPADTAPREGATEPVRDDTPEMVDLAWNDALPPTTPGATLLRRALLGLGAAVAMVLLLRWVRRRRRARAGR